MNIPSDTKCKSCIMSECRNKQYDRQALTEVTDALRIHCRIQPLQKNRNLVDKKTLPLVKSTFRNTGDSKLNL